jgi:hypothetical protein
MFTGFGVNAGIGQQQSFYRAPSHQMRCNNFSNIRFRDVPIPDGFRIDDNCWSMFTLVQAASLVDANPVLETCRVDGLLEPCLQLRFAIGITAGTSAAGFALVGTDKYVPLILCQEDRSRKYPVVTFHHKGFAALDQFSCRCKPAERKFTHPFLKEPVHIMVAGSL